MLTNCELHKMFTWFEVKVIAWPTNTKLPNIESKTTQNYRKDEPKMKNTTQEKLRII